MGSKQLKRVTAEFLIATSGRLCSYSDPSRGFRAREVPYLDALWSYLSFLSFIKVDKHLITMFQPCSNCVLSYCNSSNFRNAFRRVTIFCSFKLSILRMVRLLKQLSTIYK